MKDRDVRFHEEWLGLAQPIEGLVFSVPVLADAQITPEVSPELSAAFEAQLDDSGGAPAIRNLPRFFSDFLGFDKPGMIVKRADLPPDINFYAPEGGQEIRPSFALANGPFEPPDDDPFAIFDIPDRSAGACPPPNGNHRSAGACPPQNPKGTPSDRYFALVWDLRDDASVIDQENGFIDLDKHETRTGPWRYPPTAKFERLLRHATIPVGFICDGRELRLLYAPAGESTAHLTFRVPDMKDRAGRPVLAALHLLLHARRAYGASPEFTLPGLLAESRRRQADVTKDLAEQVFEAVEILLLGFEKAAARDCVGERLDWLRPALEAKGDHFYHGVLSVVLRLVFLLYSEDQNLLPVENDFYAEHLSVFGLYQQLSHDAGVHPESMHHRFGSYGRLLALFRAVYFGVAHNDLILPPRRGKLFDPNAYPFLEGGQPDWTAAVNLPELRAQVQPPSIDDGTLHRVLHRLIVFEGQRLSYRSLDVEQIGSVYESLMGYHVLRAQSSAVRMGKFGVWVELLALREMKPAERNKFFKEVAGLNPGPSASLEKEIVARGFVPRITSVGRGTSPRATSRSDDEALIDALLGYSPGKKNERARHLAKVGQLILQPGEERRRTGTHYTPRWLTEKVVARTLEPIFASLGEAPTVEQLLELKICDSAMGSGAFLVAACRHIADQIVKAWARSGELISITETHRDPYLHARRLVAQRCLYGVDKNPAAVELAKLSLWLVTMSKTLPFTFVDHALRHGDSLVGLDLNQIKAFHWKPKKQLDFVEKALTDSLEQSLSYRSEILALAHNEDAISQSEKRRLLEYSQQAIDKIRLVADVCVGAFFSEGSDKARETERNRRMALVQSYLAGKDEVRAELEELAESIREEQSPFHWMIEFPEVFYEERPDPLEKDTVNRAAFMEAIVGNPPFLGGSSISSNFGDSYRDWLLQLHEDSHGNGDIVAHFFRRSGSLIGFHGSIGLVATNTIGQGDTRTTGLKRLLEIGFGIYDATTNMPWTGDAAVTVSIVHLAIGTSMNTATVRFNGARCDDVNSRLRPKPERKDPSALISQRGLSFLGSKISGQGFTLTPEEREDLISRNVKNEERIFPYLGGDEVNTSPTQSHNRYVINFGQMKLEEVKRWFDLFHLVEQRVAPSRGVGRRKDDASKLSEIWWQFERPRLALYQAIAPFSRCLVISRHSKHVVFAFQPTDRVFSEAMYIFALDALSAFTVLQSRVHVPWAWLHSSSMKTDLRYTPSDCFETFPFPKPDPRSIIPELETIGERLYQARADYMVQTDQGLTKTYNKLKDPSCEDQPIVELRELHEEMDRAVLKAYGWDDIAVPSYCIKTEDDQKALQAFEDEIIDRLYVLNAERAREEERLGLKNKKDKKPAKKTKPKKSKTPEGQGGAFLMPVTNVRRGTSPRATRCASGVKM